MNIIIAEDIDVNYEIVSTFLEMYGITSVRAENVEEALTLMESVVENQYDMIFMDIQMPVMNLLHNPFPYSLLTHCRKFPVAAPATTGI